MATIERKPLPPPNSPITRITEADRDEIVARANEVIDYYLNGPGSYFESGTQKPLVSELEHSAVADLKNFRKSVIASMQFADDPNLIMRSIAELIDQRIRQIEEAAQNSRGREIVPPDTNDQI